MHDSDHDGVVRISVQANPKYSNMIYTAQFFPYQECSMVGGLGYPVGEEQGLKEQESSGGGRGGITFIVPNLLRVH